MLLGLKPSRHTSALWLRVNTYYPMNWVKSQFNYLLSCYGCRNLQYSQVLSSTLVKSQLCFNMVYIVHVYKSDFMFHFALGFCVIIIRIKKNSFTYFLPLSCCFSPPITVFQTGFTPLLFILCIHTRYAFVFYCWSHFTSLSIACSHSEKVVWKSR